MTELLNEARCLNLLVVEDEALIAMMIEDALTMFGHTVVGSAPDVASALSLADQNKVDLALCDVRLARNDSGIDAANQLAMRGIPVIYLSGNCPAAATHPLILGCVSKPFHTASLHKYVAAAYAISRGGDRASAPPALTLYPDVSLGRQEG